MKKLKLVVVSLLLASGVHAGLIIREENDTFTGSDDSYTQGLEVMYTSQLDFGVWECWGIRNLMYTPTDITESLPQPEDRPWHGRTALVYEKWVSRWGDSVRHMFEFGVSGPASRSDDIQTWFHELTGSKAPEGWENQTPNELYFNYGREIWTNLNRREYDNYGYDLSGLYGYDIGTANIDAFAGGGIRLGHGIPHHFGGGLIHPSQYGAPVSFVLYGYWELTAKLVLHNMALNGSLWQVFQQGPYVKAEPFVGDSHYGIVTGFNRVLGSEYDLRLKVGRVDRSREFEGQKSTTDFGAVHIYIMRGL